MQNTNPVAPTYPIASVDSALRLMLLFRDHSSIRVAEASEQLGVVRSTAHRLLAMLRYHGFVQQDPETKAYTPGPALWDLGFAVFHQLELRVGVRPRLERLAEELGETAHLALLSNRDIRIVDAIESGRALRTSARIGISLPAHATAAGKTLLAGLSEVELLDRYPESDLSRAGARAITSRAELLRQLEVVRAQGFATTMDEATPDVGAVAVPLRDAAGAVRASLAVSAPVARLERADQAAIVEVLQREAAGASAGLT